MNENWREKENDLSNLRPSDLFMVIANASRMENCHLFNTNDIVGSEGASPIRGINTTF